MSVQDQGLLLRSLNDLKADFPSAVLHQLLVFDYGNEKIGFSEGVISVPSPENSRTTTIRTVMCDMTSRLLGEMTVFAKRLQSASTLDTPKASNGSLSREDMLSALPLHLSGSSRPPSAAESSRSFSPAGDSSKLSHRMSLPAHIPSNRTSRSVTPDGRASSPSSGARTPPTTFDDISGTPSVVSPPRKPSHDRTRTGSQDRGSRQHEPASLGEREKIRGKGRIGVVIGSMYLLAGRWPDAAKELVQSANVARANSDYVWQAKSLDYLSVCLLMYAWAGMDFRVSLQKIANSTPFNVVPPNRREAEMSRSPMFSDQELNDPDLIPRSLLATRRPPACRSWVLSKLGIQQLDLQHSSP